MLQCEIDVLTRYSIGNVGIETDCWTVVFCPINQDFTMSFFSVEVEKDSGGWCSRPGGGGGGVRGCDLTNWVSFRCGLWRGNRAHRCQGVSQKSILYGI